MTLLQRRPRTVYRVYNEEEYLAGVDPFADWGTAPVAESKHGLSLQRFAGIAALTGAVGTVGVTVGLVGLRSHPGGRQIAVAAAPSPARSAPSIGGGRRVVVGSPTRVTPRRKVPPARVIEVAPPAPEQQPEQAKQPEQATHTPVASTSQETSAAVASAAQSAPTAEAAPEPRAQSEFGFEH